jgi:junctophilin
MDMKDGYGSYKWRDGRRYIGEWKDNQRHGKGCLKALDGTEQYGIWEHDQRVRWIEDKLSKREGTSAKQKTDSEKKSSKPDPQDG